MNDDATLVTTSTGVAVLRPLAHKAGTFADRSSAGGQMATD
jgi:hypothetical protein